MKKYLIGLLVFICVSFFNTEVFSYYSGGSPGIKKEVKIIKKLKKKKITRNIYHVYIDSAIGNQSSFRGLYHLLYTAKKSDTFIFRVNSLGGSLDTMTNMVDALRRTKAHTIGEINVAYSAGGIIIMHCKEIRVNKYATMMIHNVQLGIRGGMNNVKDQCEFYKKLNKQILTDTYRYFLTNKEMESVLNGKWIWLLESEIKKRLKRRNKIFKNKR